MASKCTKCGDTESYNFALNIGLCNPCIGERLEELEAQLKSARVIYDVYKEYAEDKVKSQAERIKNLETENKTLKDMLRKEGYEFTDFSEIKTLNS